MEMKSKITYGCINDGLADLCKPLLM